MSKHSILVAILSSALFLVACDEQGGTSYYDADAESPRISDLSPDTEVGILGGTEVALSVERLAQCLDREGEPTFAVVTFGGRNAEIVSADREDGEIVVISPPGPLGGGWVEVKLACEGGVASRNFFYDVQREGPSGTDLFENERGSITFIYMDGPFIDLPLVQTYGMIWGQEASRTSLMLSGIESAGSGPDNIRAQCFGGCDVEPTDFELPDLDRLYIGDGLRVGRSRDIAQGFYTNIVPVGQVVSPNGSGLIGWLIVYTSEDVGGVSKPTKRYFRIDAWNDEVPPEGAEHPNWLRIGADNTMQDPEDVRDAFDLPSDWYYAEVCGFAYNAFGDEPDRFPWEPDSLCTTQETLGLVWLEEGSNLFELPRWQNPNYPDQDPFEDYHFVGLDWDPDVRFYTPDPDPGQNEFPGYFKESELIVEYDGGRSFNIDIAPALWAEGRRSNTSHTITHPDDLLFNQGALAEQYGFFAYISKADDSEDLVIAWDQSGGEEAEDDFIVVQLEVIDLANSDSFFGQTQVANLTAFDWYSNDTGTLTIPATELRKLPDCGTQLLTEAEDAGETTANQDFYCQVTVARHRINRLPMNDGDCDPAQTDMGAPDACPQLVLDNHYMYFTLFTNLHNCEDGIDNDGDGLIDTSDPGCTMDPRGIVVQGELDPDEIGPECDDGVDNDGDGFVDGGCRDYNGDGDFLDEGECNQDPDCDGLGDPFESDTVAACNDGFDNDGDGWVDSLDPGCPVEDPANPEAGSCFDNADNDGDGLQDLDDPDCADTSEGGFDPTLTCNNGLDDDGDGLIDADDPGCVNGLDDLETSTCSDGIDNDGDGWTDDEDPECNLGEAGNETGFRAIGCNNGLDDDGDGWIDRDDPACVSATMGSENPTGSESWDECTDGVDNDGDGAIDSADDECTQCNDSIDNDGDGTLDAGIDLDGDGLYTGPGEVAPDADCLDAADNDESTP